jgi:uncharacterized membrane protein
MENAYLILVSIAVLGLINTIYLSFHSLNGSKVKCIGFPQEWCDKVTGSKYSKTFGIPNPFLGFGMLLTILVLLFFYNVGTVSIYPAVALISFGFLFSLYFLYLQAFVIKAFCTWCVVSAIVFTLLFSFQFYLL